MTMRINLFTKVGITAGVLMLTNGCMTASNVKAPAPKAFAISQELADDTLVSAVSYSGVTYRVRELANDEKADLNFWRERLQVQLTGAGYIFKSKKKIQAKGVQGVQLNFIAPMSSTDYQFAVALFVKDDKILVAEAAGEVKAFKPLRASITQAMGGISFK